MNFTYRHDCPAQLSLIIYTRQCHSTGENYTKRLKAGAGLCIIFNLGNRLCRRHAFNIFRDFVKRFLRICDGCVLKQTPWDIPFSTYSNKESFVLHTLLIKLLGKYFENLIIIIIAIRKCYYRLSMCLPSEGVSLLSW